MGLMDMIRHRVRSFLRLEEPNPLQIQIQRELDYTTNAAKNNIWYRGKADELHQLYHQLRGPVTSNCFWAASSSSGMEMRMIHTGIPSVIVDTLTGITAQNLDQFVFDSQAYDDLWEKIMKDNKFRDLLKKAIKKVLVVGDGAFKISIDTDISEYPIIEFYAGDRVDYIYRRGRLHETIFKSEIEAEGDAQARYELKEIYGRGYVRYELYRNDEPAELTDIESLQDLRNVEFGDTENRYMWAVPVKFFPSEEWEGRGKSIFDSKTDNFDALDEAWSQWMDALRDGRSKTYIPENLIPRDPNTGALRRPNAFDNRFISTGQNMEQNAVNKIQTEQPTIQHDSYIATYTSALDQSLQGLISPSTLGIDIKKLDNAEAQREKEKVTLYTRSEIVEALQEDLSLLAETAVKVYFEMRSQPIPADISCDVVFGDYANPSFEARVETVGKARTQSIMSVEAAVEELYGDTRDDEWKAEEVKRIKEEAGTAQMEEPDYLADKSFEA